MIVVTFSIVYSPELRTEAVIDGFGKVYNNVSEVVYWVAWNPYIINILL